MSFFFYAIPGGQFKSENLPSSIFTHFSGLPILNPKYVLHLIWFLLSFIQLYDSPFKGSRAYKLVLLEIAIFNSFGLFCHFRFADFNENYQQCRFPTNDISWLLLYPDQYTCTLHIDVFSCFSRYISFCLPLDDFPTIRSLPVSTRY